MRLKLARAAAAGLALALAAACGHDTTGPAKPGPAAKLAAVGSDSMSATVGTPVTLVVKVTDAKNIPVPNANVAFAVSAGNGTVTPQTAITDANGQAQTMFVVGTIAGANQVTVTESDPTLTIPPVRFRVIGNAGAAASLSLASHVLRLPVGVDSGRVTATVTDLFGNSVTPGATWTVRDPSQLTVDANGNVRVLTRGGQTYIVATAGGKTDSVFAVLLSATQSPCTALATSTSLSVGQVFTGISNGYACVHADQDSSVYILAPYFNASVPASTMQIEVNGYGLGTIAPNLAPLANRVIGGGRLSPVKPTYVRYDAFDYQLRQRERALEPLASAARNWYSSAKTSGTLGRYRLQPSRSVSSMSGLSPNTPPSFFGSTANPQVGDLLTLNVSLTDCTSPAYRIGRVAAVTQKAVVVADTSNPAGGFTDTDFQTIGATFDTLVDPLDEQNFGSPVDIDGNKRVVLFFTSAVNQIPTDPGSIVLGFFYSRDIYPQATKDSIAGCAGSNQGEMFYLLVPDSLGTVSGGKKVTKPFVETETIATTAHEFQHLINAERRLYVNHAAFIDEEAWLNEGLSHIAEELLFYRVSGLSPRQNLDSTAVANNFSAYKNYESNNALRYNTYLSATFGYAPVGANFYDDVLQTRGAIWSFLRYAADRRGSSDGTFWYNLVNSTTIGMTNLTNVLGTDPMPWMHDWAISNYLDDRVPGVAAQYTQPSWNTRSYFTAAGIFFPLADAQLTPLAQNVQQQRTLRGGGVTFYRFTVPTGTDALLAVTSNSQPLPSSMQLAVIRVK